MSCGFRTGSSDCLCLVVTFGGVVVYKGLMVMICVWVLVGVVFFVYFVFFFFQTEDGIRDAQESRGLGDVYKRQLTVQMGLKILFHGIQKSFTSLKPKTCGRSINMPMISASTPGHSLSMLTNGSWMT